MKRTHYCGPIAHHTTFEVGEIVWIPDEERGPLERRVVSMLYQGNGCFTPPPGQPHVLLAPLGYPPLTVASWWRDVFRLRRNAEMVSAKWATHGWRYPHESPYDAAIAEGGQRLSGAWEWAPPAHWNGIDDFSRPDIQRWLDLDKVERCLKIAAPFVANRIVDS